MEDIDYSDPFKVRIIEDCRDSDEYGPSGKLDGQYGVCLGLYNFPNIWEKTRIKDNGNPLILTDSGDYIWGIECWWDPNPDENGIPLNLQQKVLQIHKEILRKKFGMDFDPSSN